MKTSVDIFSGFLGAGKTTLIKKLLSERVYSENVVIIENEFGKVPIDGSFLKKTNIKVKEINAGCICCTISGDFRKAIEEVCDKYKPERIIIEPSGVGKLSEILGVINSAEVRKIADLDLLITLIDTTKFNAYITNFGEFYKDQIKNAKCIVLTRTELQSREKIQAIVEQIKKLNANCSIVTTPIEQLKADKVIKAAKENFKTELLNQAARLTRTKLNVVGKAVSNNYKHNADEIFDSYGMETPMVYNKSKLLNNLNKLADEKLTGTVLRAKGIVQVENKNWIEFDYVPNELNIRDTTADFTGRVCVIGCKINKDYINKLFTV
jgi:G3E family GTPase